MVLRVGSSSGVGRQPGRARSAEGEEVSAVWCTGHGPVDREEIAGSRGLEVDPMEGVVDVLVLGAEAVGEFGDGVCEWGGLLVAVFVAVFDAVVGEDWGEAGSLESWVV